MKPSVNERALLLQRILATEGDPDLRIQVSLEDCVELIKAQDRIEALEVRLSQ